MSAATAQRALLRLASSAFKKTQDSSTPHGPKSKVLLNPEPKRDEHKEIVDLELGKIIALTDKGTWARSLYTNLVDVSEINAFLESIDEYDTVLKRWLNLPETASRPKEETLYQPIVTIINSILKRFVLSDGEGGELLREAIDTHKTNLPHQAQDPTNLQSRPDVSIKARGSSFQEPRSKPGHPRLTVGFSNMSSLVEVKVEKSETSLKDQHLQVAVYVRQIFIQQPNRQFVRVLLLTEQNARLYHFDRSGGVYSPDFDFHKEAHTFIRLVVGLNSLDEATLGLDVSIKWTVKHGRKKAVNASEPAVRSIGLLQQVTQYFEIRGPASQCWSVVDPGTGTQYLVKDCWRVDDRVPEYEHLEAAQGLPGVVQMVSFEANRGETKGFRSPFDITHFDFYNRVADRVVMNSYGETITKFRCPMELLYALRDAIAGHMELYMKQLLHRDISTENIVLGRKDPDSEPEQGCWGMLIDLHMAIDVGRPGPSKDWKIGARLYQSIAVLLTCHYPRIKLAQDHLDDLESFFYVYTYIIYGYDESGFPYPVHSTLLEWMREAPLSAANNKVAFLIRRNVPQSISSRWPKPCIDLLAAYRKFLLPFVLQKRELIETELENKDEEIEIIMDGIDEQYDAVLDLFTQAIEALKALENTPPAEDVGRKANRFRTPPREPEPPVPDAGPSETRNLKRTLDEYPEEVPEAKRVDREEVEDVQES
ncbi:hypothetical protein MD484_g6302, partial [Candolleomyces efflorescens]